jgi:hypothetical protein
MCWASRRRAEPACGGAAREEEKKEFARSNSSQAAAAPSEAARLQPMPPPPVGCTPAARWHGTEDPRAWLLRKKETTAAKQVTIVKGSAFPLGSMLFIPL